MHLHYSTILMLTPTTNSSITELEESVIFQPVLQAYPTWHSWIITAHVSLGNLESHGKSFNRQLDRTQQLLQSLDQQPSAPTQLLSTLQVELSNIEGIYNSVKTTIISAVKLLQSNQPDTHLLQEELTTLPWRWSQLAHWNCHCKRYTQHENKDKSANHYTGITARNPSVHCINIKCH